MDGSTSLTVVQQTPSVSIPNARTQVGQVTGTRIYADGHTETFVRMDAVRVDLPTGTYERAPGDFSPEWNPLTEIGGGGNMSFANISSGKK